MRACTRLAFFERLGKTGVLCLFAFALNACQTPIAAQSATPSAPIAAQNTNNAAAKAVLDDAIQAYQAQNYPLALSLFA